MDRERGCGKSTQRVPRRHPQSKREKNGGVEGKGGGKVQRGLRQGNEKGRACRLGRTFVRSQGLGGVHRNTTKEGEGGKAREEKQVLK